MRTATLLFPLDNYNRNMHPRTREEVRPRSQGGDNRGAAFSTSAPTVNFTHLQLFTLTSGLLGLQFCWAVQIGYVTKTLLELGLPQRFVSYAWLAGPVAGVVVQPIVGILSDRCTSPWGRRRPFLMIGALFSSVSLLLFAYAGEIGTRLGDPIATASEFVIKPRALCIAITSFWILDFSINAAQGPIRALLADVVPPNQHNVGNAYFAFATGIGNFTGSILGSLKLARTFTFFAEDIQALFSITAFVLLLSMSCTVIFTKEVPLLSHSTFIRVPTASTERSSQHTNAMSSYDSLEPDTHLDENNLPVGHTWFSLFFEAARKAPYPFWRLFIVQCFSWFGWFTMYVFVTSWIGAEVYNGSFSAPVDSPKRLLYDEGVRMGNFSLALQSAVAIVLSPLLPYLISRTTPQFIYLIATVLFGTVLSSALVLDQKWQAPFAAGAIASTGFAWVVTMTIPWSLMGQAVAKAAPQHAGVFYTMFNLSQCFPEIAVSLLSEEVERITHRQAVVLGLGGVSVFIAALLIIALDIGQSEGVSTRDDSISAIS